MTDEEAVRRAERAEMFLRDELFKEAIQKLRDQSFEDFKSAKINDLNALRDARALLDITERFMNIFINVVRDGVIPQRRLDAKRTTAKPVS